MSIFADAENHFRVYFHAFLEEAIHFSERLCKDSLTRRRVPNNFRPISPSQDPCNSVMSKFKKHVDLTIAARNLREVVLLQMKQLYNEDLKPCHIYPSLYI